MKLVSGLHERVVTRGVETAIEAAIVAMVNPEDVGTIDELKRLTGLNIEPVVASELEIATAIAKYYGPSRQ